MTFSIVAVVSIASSSVCCDNNTIGYVGVVSSAKLFVVKVLHMDYASKPSLNSTYRVAFGTGQAAAHVSGVAALMFSAGKTDLVARDVYQNALPPEQQGLGLIDALQTVQ